MPLPMSARELEHLHLARGEVVLGLVERNLMPHWISIAGLGMAIIVASLTLVEEPFTWGTFFLGTVALAFTGALFASERYILTDRRFVRTGWRGRREVVVAKLERSPGAFGETLVAVGKDGERIRVTNVKNAQQLCDAWK